MEEDEVHRSALVELEIHVGEEHSDGALREVEDARDAVRQNEAGPRERVDAPHHQADEDSGEEIGHPREYAEFARRTRLVRDSASTRVFRR